MARIANSRFPRRVKIKGSPKPSPRSVSGSPRQSGRAGGVGFYGANAYPSARNKAVRKVPYHW